MRNIILLFLFIPVLVFSQIIETHEFGTTNTQWYIYLSGKTWEFTAENNMNIETIEVKSILASTTGTTVHIEVTIQNDIVASWDQYLDDNQYNAYYHTKSVTYPLHKGDKIIYKIYGWSNSTYTAGIGGINYLRLIGTEGAGYDLQFSSLADMNNARFGFGYISNGDFIYSASGGINESPWRSTSIERYSLRDDIWTEFANGLIPRLWCSTEYISSQNKIYIFNGETYTSDTYTDTIEIIDAETGTISYSALNPYPVEYGGSAVWNDKIYIFGGSNSGVYSNRLYEFDPQTNSWTRLPDMWEAKQTNGEIINGVLYVFGGYNGSTSKRIDAYNIQNSSWTYVGDMPNGISAHATTKSGRCVWLVGSYDNIRFLAKYDTETGNFTQLSSNMTGRRHSGATVAGNNLYIFGGNQVSNSTSTLNSLEYADISDYVVSTEYTEIITPVDLQLNQNYPNPFNPNTTIYYSLPNESVVTITVYDMLGKEINQLVSQNQLSGNHSIQWNGTDQQGNLVPAGIYFYQLQTGGLVQTKKMVLMK